MKPSQILGLGLVFGGTVGFALGVNPASANEIEGAATFSVTTPGFTTTTSSVQFRAIGPVTATGVTSEATFSGTPGDNDFHVNGGSIVMDGIVWTNPVGSQTIEQAVAAQIDANDLTVSQLQGAIRAAASRDSAKRQVK